MFKPKGMMIRCAPKGHVPEVSPMTKDYRMSLTEALVLYEAVKPKAHLDAEDSGKVIWEGLDWCKAMISFKFHKRAARTWRSTRRITSR